MNSKSCFSFPQFVLACVVHVRDRYGSSSSSTKVRVICSRVGQTSQDSNLGNKVKTEICSMGLMYKICTASTTV